MQRRLDGEQGVRLVAVTPGKPAALAAFRRELGLTCTLLSDPEWRVQHSLGMGRARSRDLFGVPRIWWLYLRALAHGRRQRRPREDIHLLGGVVVLDRDGEAVWRYDSRDAGDYAAPDEIVAAATSPARA